MVAILALLTAGHPLVKGRDSALGCSVARLEVWAYVSLLEFQRRETAGFWIALGLVVDSRGFLLLGYCGRSTLVCPDCVQGWARA